MAWHLRNSQNILLHPDDYLSKMEQSILKLEEKVT
jgi:hypothetical protein